MFTHFKENPPFTLPWSHYLILMRIKDENERKFYEIEAAKSQWNVRQLQRQYSSSLYERLLLSSDKSKVIELSTQGLVVQKPEDIVKDPMVLEFLGFPAQAVYSETELETRLLNHLQEFIMLAQASLSPHARSVLFLTRISSIAIWSCTIGCCVALCCLI